MTIESYFKNKINWKIFNAMLDATTNLEDNSLWFSLSVMTRSLYNEFYDTVYYYTCDINNQPESGYDTDVIDADLDETIRCYHKYGLFFKLAFMCSYDQEDNYKETKTKIDKIKNIKIVIDNDDSIIYQEIDTET